MNLEEKGRAKVICKNIKEDGYNVYLESTQPEDYVIGVYFGYNDERENFFWRKLINIENKNLDEIELNQGEKYFYKGFEINISFSGHEWTYEFRIEGESDIKEDVFYIGSNNADTKSDIKEGLEKAIEIIDEAVSKKDSEN